MKLQYSYGIVIELSSVSIDDQRQIHRVLSNRFSDTITLSNFTDVDAVSISRTVDKQLFDEELTEIEKDIQQEAKRFATTISECFLSKVKDTSLVMRPVLLAD